KNTAATFSSSNTKVASVVANNGVITFKDRGSVYIRIKGNDGRNYKVKFNVMDKTYARVSIKGQYAELYKNGKRVKKVPVVTGKPGRTATPKGTFKIAYKTRNTYLDGSTVGYDYYLPVKYWIPLANTGGVGFHDASWRTYKSFGKGYYKWDGSHGCINMRTGDAAYFYKHLSKGTQVKIF
ncbi:MAG: L,D-transpeptidase, partial [Erysipelotrichales bacterium]